MRAASLLLLLVSLASARETAGWNHITTPHFDIYSDSEIALFARALALGFERLHAFFVRQVGIAPRPHREVRVICFASAREYALYRKAAGADAYFIGAESRDYIVLPAFPHGDPRVAAHEYAHVLIQRRLETSGVGLRGDRRRHFHSADQPPRDSYRRRPAGPFRHSSQYALDAARGAFVIP